jgi:hypothetical protein
LVGVDGAFDQALVAALVNQYPLAVADFFHLQQLSVDRNPVTPLESNPQQRRSGMGEVLELAAAGKDDVDLSVVGPENGAESQLRLCGGDPTLAGLDVQHRRIVLILTAKGKINTGISMGMAGIDNSGPKPEK